MIPESLEKLVDLAMAELPTPRSLAVVFVMRDRNGRFSAARTSHHVVLGQIVRAGDWRTVAVEIDGQDRDRTYEALGFAVDMLDRDARPWRTS